MTTAHAVVSRAEWLEARKAHLVREKEVIRELDRLRAERRALPWVKVEETYVFDGPDGRRTLGDLFNGRGQLVVQHFMLTPGSGRPCEGCSLMADHVDAARQHFEQADLSFVAISRAPWSEIAPVKSRMGWHFPWLSSNGSDFNYDYGVSFTPEAVASGNVGYNYGTSPYAAEELHGVSVFRRNEAGEIFHTYSTYARGAEYLIGAFHFLDLVPKGRNESGTMDWVRLHDEYPQPKAAAGCPACHPGNGAKQATPLAAKSAMATVPVRDLSKAREFYERILGLEPLDGDEPSVQGYRAGGSSILVYESGFAGTNQATAVSWPLGADFDVAIQDLKAKGVAFEHYDMPGTTHDGDIHVAGDMRVAWFKDPDGNIINLGNY
jgi:predicted dithiol-disulfide oxidoreductase (DUF899 family)/catechol 2,3-dioxygenase-like lactoylglutathione lyase family enzyme